MEKGSVGADIVSIITESLYDKPIVVFREYVQNAVDAIGVACSVENSADFSTQIWLDGKNLFFLDNGTGINHDGFQWTMTAIANSGKKRAENIGYKGIGRLSGIPYCNKISFVNIVNYKNHCFQEYIIDCNKYRDLQKSEAYHELDFDALMGLIGSMNETQNTDEILSIIGKYNTLFANRNTGFLVVLKDISTVLMNVIEDSQFLSNLGWLLPIPFLPDLVDQSAEDNQNYELFTELASTNPLDTNAPIPTKSFHISYNGNRIYRPLEPQMIRTYLCKSNIDQYAICVHTFSNKKIEIDRNNPFSGIRIYIDNMLLCDENELIPALQQYGLIRQGSTYEVIQSVRGIGAIIYIVDKVSISSNARRTFIDVTDADSFRFLELIGEFVDSIFKARYALSKYDSAKRNEETEKEKLNSSRQNALNSLVNLARSDISLTVEESIKPVEFHNLSKTEQRRIVKNDISRQLNTQLKKYLLQTEEYNLETCFSDFKTWLSAN